MHVFETFMATHEEEKYLLEYVVLEMLRYVSAMNAVKQCYVD